MKKVLSVIVLCIFMVSLIGVASAGTNYTLFGDYKQLSDDQAYALNTIGQQMVDTYDYAAILVDYGTTALDSLQDTAISDFAKYGADCDKGVVLVIDDDSYRFEYFGEAEKLDEDYLWESYWNATTFYDGAYAFMTEVAVEVEKEYTPTSTTVTSSTLVTDNANLLTADQLNALETQLEEIKAETGCETAILTLNDSSVTENTIKLYTTDYYNRNYSGNGACLVICMYERDWKYTFFGSAYDQGAYNDDTITNLVSQYLKSGDYYTAFKTFANITKDVYTGTDNSKSYREFNWGKGLLIAVIGGFVLAFIVMSILKSKLNSVHMQADANEYTRPGSMNITRGGDMFLYKNVTRTAKPKESSSGGSSRSGGGGGARGGGGKF